MIGFIMFILCLCCFIPLAFAGVGKISWRTAGILTPIGLFLVFFGLYWAGVYMDSLWFDNLRYHAVFWKMFSLKWAGFIISAVVVYIIARLGFWGMERSVLEGKNRATSYLREISCAALAFIFGVVMYCKWNSLVLFLNGDTFGISDPIFGKDIGFYIFHLQFYNTVSGLLIWALMASAVVLGFFCLYYLANREGMVDVRKMSKFACLFGIAVLGTFVWMRFLSNYSYMFSTGGVVYGVGYTDMSRILWNKILIGFVSLSMILLLVGAFRQNLFRRVAFSTALGLPLGILFCLLVVPACVQSVVVAPNEFQKEKPYIENNISFTRAAYNLQAVAEIGFVPSALTSDICSTNKDTLDNVRVWDWRALASVYEQLQSFRLYYTFPDVDIDRYVVNGDYRQVMLAAREIDQNRLAEKTWVNTHLIYTHGCGVIMNEVNSSENGVPILLLENIPPQSTVGEIKVTKPEIYFGDYTGGYVIANSKTAEFDYPRGDKNVFCHYSGQGGVEVNTLVRKLAAAFKFGDLKILLTGQIDDNSKLMWNRNIQDRIKALVPYLAPDVDNYLVVRSDGTLSWIEDTYTFSKYYPYATPYCPGVNYIRNSVKAVVDAYSGEVTLYVFDETDPIINAYQSAFPELFKDSGLMPDDLMAHIRYPEDMLSAQASMYAVFHMTDPMVFYNKEDVWVFSHEVLEQEQAVIPYYVIIRLPDGSKEEFLQMIPLTPSGKQNAIAWLAGRCDGENYGKLVVYKFPKQTLVYGSMQFEAVINQKDEMASQFTLWTKTSTVIRGNTLIIPIGDSLIYIEPIYLKSETTQMPQLVRVVVGGQDKDGNLQVAWGENFPSALNSLLGTQAVITPTPTSVQPTGILSTLQRLLQRLEGLKTASMQDFPKELDSIIDLLKGILAGAK